MQEKQQKKPKSFRPVRAINKGYSESGGSYTKKALKGMIPNSGAPYEDIDENNYTLRQRARMLYMSAPVCTSAIKTNRTNVIGNGLRLKSTINRAVLGMSQEQAEEWQKNTEAEFDLWASRKNACDATGMNDFYGMQQLCLSSWLMSGDVFGLIKRTESTLFMPYSLRLHIIEADRVRTPRISAGIGYPSSLTKVKADNGNIIYDGVEVSPDGMVQAYHIANTYPYEMTAEKTEFVRVEAYGKKTGLPNILHIMESERPDQYRGVPYLAQVIEPMLQMRRYTEAEIMAAVVQSFHTAFVVTEAGANDMPFNEVISEEHEISRDPNEYEMGPGTINIMEPGEDIRFATPTHPNTGFDVFMKAMCTQVGAALEIPKELLLKEFNSSYSASRGALLEAWKVFRMRRVWLTNDLCRPIYEIWMTEAVARGRITAPGFLTDPLIRQAYLGSEWIGPSQGMLDPTKELQAATMAIENGLSTHEQEAIKLNGSEFTANIDKLAIENEKIRIATGRNQPNFNVETVGNEEETEEETGNETE